MNKIFMVVFVVVFLGIGCSVENKRGRHTGGDTYPEFEELCINGVVYYTRGISVAPAFKPDGDLYLCAG